MKKTKRRKGDIPLRRLAYPLHDAFGSLLPGLERLEHALVACAVVANSRRLVSRCSSAVLLRPVLESCIDDNQNGNRGGGDGRTDCAGCITRDFAENRSALPQQLVDSSVALS